MEKLIVVIVSWNTVDLTRDCLVSLYKELDRLEVDAEVWVVDNASSDDSVAMIKREYPKIKLIENDDNVGFAKANNQIIHRADGDYYLLLNTDTIVHEASIEMMLRYFRAHAEIGAVGPRLVYPDGGVQQSITRLPSVKGELKYCLAYHFFPFSGLFQSAFKFDRDNVGTLTQPTETEVLSAACLMLRREVIDQVGVLGEDYFLFSEENDYFFRMKQAGFRSCHLPTAKITHLVGASRRKKGSADSQANFLKSRLTFFRKHLPRAAGRVRAIYRFFLCWSSWQARLTYRIKGRRDDQFVQMYDLLRQTLKSSR